MRPGIQIFINLPNSEVITLNNISLDLTIDELKAILELKAGILSELQVLYFCNKKLENRKDLYEVKVKNGSVIRLKIKEESLQLIYNYAVGDKLVELFQMGLQFMTHEENDPSDQIDCVKSWNKLAPLRAFLALFAACYKGYLPMIIELLKNSAAAVGMTSKHGRNALHVAAFHGNVKTVSLLLTQGADYTQVDKFGSTPVELASSNGHLSCERRIWLFQWTLREQNEKSRHSDDDLDSIARTYFHKYQSIAETYTETDVFLPKIDMGVKKIDEESKKVRTKTTRLPRIANNPFSTHLSKNIEMHHGTSLPECNAHKLNSDYKHTKKSSKQNKRIVTPPQEELSKVTPPPTPPSKVTPPPHQPENATLTKDGAERNEWDNDASIYDNNSRQQQNLASADELPRVFQLFVKACDKISDFEEQKTRRKSRIFNDLEWTARNKFTNEKLESHHENNLVEKPDKLTITTDPYKTAEYVQNSETKFSDSISPTCNAFEIKRNNFFKSAGESETESSLENFGEKIPEGFNSENVDLKVPIETEGKLPRKTNTADFQHINKSEKDLNKISKQSLESFIMPKTIESPKEIDTQSSVNGDSTKPREKRVQFVEIENLKKLQKNSSQKKNRSKEKISNDEILNTAVRTFGQRSSNSQDNDNIQDEIVTLNGNAHTEQATVYAQNNYPIQEKIQENSSISKCQKDIHIKLVENKEDSSSSNSVNTGDTPSNNSGSKGATPPVKSATLYMKKHSNNKKIQRFHLLQRSKSLDYINGIEAKERVLKNQIAFEKWLQTKKRKRTKSKSETDETHQNRVSYEYELSFEKWLAKKEDNSKRSINENLTQKSKKTKLNRHITFDEWLLKKVENKKIEIEKQKQSETENKTEKNSEEFSFEKWLLKKKAMKQKEIEIQKSLEEEERKRIDHKIQSRLYDPHQRTFEEWFLEKKYNSKHEKKFQNPESSDHHMRRKTFPEDSNFVYQMWLNDKLKQDYEKELRNLKLSRRSNYSEKEASMSSEIDSSEYDDLCA